MSPAYGLCRLDDGSIKGYHAASPMHSTYPYDRAVFRHVGVGVIIKAGGHAVTSTERLRFYALRQGVKRVVAIHGLGENSEG